VADEDADQQHDVMSSRSPEADRGLDRRVSAAPRLPVHVASWRPKTTTPTLLFLLLVVLRNEQIKTPWRTLKQQQF
jgi:hypothetical protein